MLLANIAVVDEVRAANRRELAEQTTLRLDEQPCDVNVFNLSATGCLVRADSPLLPGSEVRIGLPGAGAFLARVVRTDGAHAGCRFHVPLSPEQLESAFQSEVVIDGSWNYEPHRVDGLDGPGLSARARLTWIVGLSAALWAGIAAGIAQFG